MNICNKSRRFYLFAAIVALSSQILIGCAIIHPPARSQPALDVVDTLSTWMNVGIDSHGKKDELRASLYYQKPDKLRLDARGAFNEPRAIVLLTGETFRIYFVAENELIEDKLTDQVVKKIFDVDIRVSDIRSSVFANPFLDGNMKDLRIEDYGDEYVIYRRSKIKDCREEISILAEDKVVRKWQIKDSKGKLVQDITFSDYKEVGGILRPLKAIINRPGDRTRLTIQSVNPEINVKLQNVVFDLPVPDDVRKYTLSDL